MSASSEGTLYFGVRVPFMEVIGLVAVERGPDWARTRLPYRREMANRTGNMHGGMLMSGLDFTMSAAVVGAESDIASLATIDMNTSFIGPVSGDVMLEARCLRRGRSIAFAEGEARDEKGMLVCRTSATFKIVRK